MTAATGDANATAHVNALWASTLLDALVAGGIAHVCVSPGSRSTPLAWAVAGRAGVALGEPDGPTDGPTDGSTDVVAAGGAKPAAGDRADASAARLTCSVHLDERAAGYFAVGYAAATGRPVALVCTSGTAAANYLPAVVEAHHSRLPLVVLTADRPPDLRDRGAWQAIDQVKLFGGFVRWYHELGEASSEPAALRYAAAVAARAAATARGPIRGPVHLNIPFREPLGPPTPTVASSPATAPPSPERAELQLGPDRPSSALPPPLPTPHSRTLRLTPSTAVPDPAAVAELAERIAAAPRGLIVVGRPMLAPEDAAAVRALARASGYPVLAEPLSGLRYGGHDGGHDGETPAGSSTGAIRTDAAIGTAFDNRFDTLLVTGYDAFLRPFAGLEVPAPDVVVRIGGSLTWKHVTDYLGRAEAAWQAAIDPEWTWDDPTSRVALRVPAGVAATCAAVCDVLATSGRAAPRDGVSGERASDGLPATSRAPRPADEAGRAAWRAWWLSADRAAAGVRRAFTSAPDAPGRDGDPGRGGTGWIYPSVLDLLPEDAVLFAANSMAVRDLDTFTAPTAGRLTALANRGAAGIDGTLSSALGAAFGARRPTVLVTGDLAFLHDAGGFGAVADVIGRYGRDALDLFVVIVDDGGGGIFEHLPVAAADRTRFETFFATPQRVDLSALCAAWGVPCAEATDAASLRAAASADAAVRAAVVTVDRAANTAVHRAYWRLACEAVAAATADIDA